MAFRSPIVVVMGHVDHGKTTLLDKIRGTAIALAEPGRITQHIGCTEIPLETIKRICGELIDRLKVRFTIPGLLFIDTPGHEAFANLRRRGGSIADLAVLVIDIIEGFQPQTFEAIEILKHFNAHFVVAANKIDLLPNWKAADQLSFLKSIERQKVEVIAELEKRIARLVANLEQLGYEAERFDRVEDFMKEIAIVPTSGMTGEGIAELLMLLIGIAQRYLEENLRIEVEGPAKGGILEVKEVKGIGKAIDVLLYDGTLREGDTIVIGGIEKAIVTKARGLLKPLPLMEMRAKAKFKRVKEVHAAAGVRIIAPEAEQAIAGMPLRGVWKEEEMENVVKEIEREVREVLVGAEREGIIVKADSLGSAEALVGMLRKRGIKVKEAGIGEVSKRDVITASEQRNVKEEYGAIIAFNVRVQAEAAPHLEESGVKLIEGNIIYQVVDDYLEWAEELRRREEEEELSKLIRPTKIKLLPAHVFRQSKPAIVGIEVLAGLLKPKLELMRRDKKVVGRILQIQVMGKSVGEAREGERVAISIDGPTVGRQIKEGDILWVKIPIEQVKMWEEKFSERLSVKEKEALNEVKDILLYGGV